MKLFEVMTVEGAKEWLNPARVIRVTSGQSGSPEEAGLWLADYPGKVMLVRSSPQALTALVNAALVG